MIGRHAETSEVLKRGKELGVRPVGIFLFVVRQVHNGYTGGTIEQFKEYVIAIQPPRNRSHFRSEKSMSGGCRTDELSNQGCAFLDLLPGLEPPHVRIRDSAGD
jgi:hypothetical protein